VEIRDYGREAGNCNRVASHLLPEYGGSGRRVAVLTRFGAKTFTVGSSKGFELEPLGRVLWGDSAGGGSTSSVYPSSLLSWPVPLTLT
jgi:hypothetical protein